MAISLLNNLVWTERCHHQLNELPLKKTFLFPKWYLKIIVMIPRLVTDPDFMRFTLKCRICVMEVSLSLKVGIEFVLKLITKHSLYIFKFLSNCKDNDCPPIPQETRLFTSEKCIPLKKSILIAWLICTSDMLLQKIHRTKWEATYSNKDLVHKNTI